MHLRKISAAAGALLMLIGTLVLSTAVGAAPTAGQQSEQAQPGIQVVFTPSGTPGSPICLPPALAMRQSTRSDATTFRLIIRVSAPLCSRLDAVAAIYRMPGNGVAWPQTLLETAPFSLKQPGTTEVIFTKTCTPAQFDVITGATPPTVSPTGPWHGPLLFPFDLSTSLQWWGCGPSSTTSSTTTSSTSTTIDDDCDNYTPSNVTVTPSTAAPGSTLTVSGTGTPGTSIQVQLRPPTGTKSLSAAQSSAGFVALSNPVVVGPDGRWSTTVIVPADAVAGVWTVAANAVGCEAVVTTNVTVTGSEDSSSTVPNTQAPVVAGDEVSNTMAPAAVAGASQERSNGSAANSGSLAYTGTSTHIPVVAGIVLITAGGLLLLGGTRRRRHA